MKMRGWLATTVAVVGLTVGAMAQSLSGLPTASAEAGDCQGSLDSSNCAPATQNRNVAGTSTGAARVISPTLASQSEADSEDASVDARNAVRFQNRKLPPLPPSEFQQMVADSAGKMLPIFGAELFRQPPSTFAPINQTAVPADYVVGPGDQLLVSIWGSVSAELRVVVNRDGTVFIPKVGEVNVAGVRASSLDERFRGQIGRIFRNFDVSVSLGKLRSIDIFLVGQARQPGNYTVSPLSTLVNAIFAAGGPSPQGSMRHVQLRRDGRIVTELDLYDLLLHGDKSKDIPLQPGDVIFIPAVGSQVAVTGSVNAPAIYELSGAQNSLSDVLELAGGLDNVADGSNVTIERIDHHQSRSVREYALDREGLKQSVEGSDIVRVFAIVPRFENTVTLRGNVANPGRYPWHQGMRIRDLIPSPQMLLTRDYWSAKNCIVDGRSTQYRTVKDLPKTPVLPQTIPSAQSAQAATQPSTQPLSAAMPVVRETDTTCQELRLARERVEISASAKLEMKTDQLLKESRISEPEINWEYASIQRVNPVDLTSSLLPFSLGKAVLENNDADNLELNAGDIVTVFSQRDIAVSRAKQTKLVRVEGEVRSPGIYKVREGESLRELIQEAGGLTVDAYLYGARFTREAARVEQQEALDKIVSQLEIQVQEKSVSNSKTNPENAASISMQSESQKALVQQMRNTPATGRVVLSIQPGDNTIAALPEIVLEDGDRLQVPARSATVSVVGSIYNQSSFLYRKGATVGSYIVQSGTSSTADLKRALLVRANGAVIGRSETDSLWHNSFNSIRVLPGDTIVIPAKLDTGGFSKALRDWLQIASQGAIAAAVVVK